MLEMGSHESFGHLHHKLWQKEKPGVKLTFWLLTTKSRESTRPRCVQVECDTPLESFQWELQVFFRPHPNQRSEQKVITPQSGGVKTGTVSGLLLGSPGIKSHSDVGATDKCKKYYMGEGGGFPWIQVVVSLVSLGSPMACPCTKGVPESELTNLLVGWMQIRVSNQKLVTLPSPILELQHAPLYPF
jgi:hypothetical protein